MFQILQAPIPIPNTFCITEMFVTTIYDIKAIDGRQCAVRMALLDTFDNAFISLTDCTCMSSSTMNKISLGTLPNMYSKHVRSI